MYRFGDPLKKQPQFFSPNGSKQSVFVISTADDVIYYNREKDIEMDIDEAYNIKIVKQVKYDEED